MTGRMEYRTQLTFRSRLHRIAMIESNKLALSSKDDKRIYLEDDGINSFARGHWRTREKVEN